MAGAANDRRPALTQEISVHDFKSYYWLKDELVKFCREQDIDRAGSKLEISARVEAYLAGDRVISPERRSPPHNCPASAGSPGQAAAPDLGTIIGTGYTNSQANRAFFQSVIGPGFHFTTRFMRFCREHPEKTYGDAVSKWHAEQAEKRSGRSREPIAPQFEYNRFVRDYLATHKGETLKNAVMAWNEQKQLRR